MLCGELPFRGSRLMLLDQVQHDDPRPPRRINERIPRDLETICLKAMAKLPAKRYQTADEFAADLRRFLAGEPVHARRAGRVDAWCAGAAGGRATPPWSAPCWACSCCWPPAPDSGDRDRERAQGDRSGGEPRRT